MASFNPKKLQILQWNCRSIIQKIDRLKVLLTNFDIDVFCLNETWLGTAKFFRIPKYNIIRKDRDTSFGGVLIGIRDNIEFKYTNVSFQTQIEYVAVTIRKEIHEFSIICFYIPPNTNFSLSEIKSILNEIPSPFYISGDFNAHNFAWGSEKTDGRGSLIMDLIDDLNLNILNDGSITRIAVPPNNHSCVDLSLCSNNLSMQSSWRTIDQPNGSDHLPILIVMQTSADTVTFYEASTPDLCKNVNWVKFSDLVSISLINIVNSDIPIDN